MLRQKIWWRHSDGTGKAYHLALRWPADDERGECELDQAPKPQVEGETPALSQWGECVIWSQVLIGWPQLPGVWGFLSALRTQNGRSRPYLLLGRNAWKETDKGHIARLTHWYSILFTSIYIHIHLSINHFLLSCFVFLFFYILFNEYLWIYLLTDAKVHPPLKPSIYIYTHPLH